MSVEGTSFATPLVGGCIALLLQARPQLTPFDVCVLWEGPCCRHERIDGVNDILVRWRTL